MPSRTGRVRDLFEHRSQVDPDAIAVRFRDSFLSYGELDRETHRLAHHLIERGVGPEDVVGVFMDGCLERVVAFMGIVKSSAALVGLDPGLPPTRLRQLLDQARPKLVLTRDALGDRLPPGVDALRLDADAAEIRRSSPQAPPERAQDDNLGFLIFTSGSTGQPKGVSIPRGCFDTYARTVADAYDLGPGDRVLQFTSVGVDVIEEEIFPPLMSGATVVVRTDEQMGSVATFLESCEALDLSVLILPTAYWHELVASITRTGTALPSSVRLVVVGGESALPDRLAAWRLRVDSSVTLFNAYGPAEATIGATLWNMSGPPSEEELPAVSIGGALPGVEVFVLDRQSRRVEDGELGELVIGGVGVGRGYLDRPELTAASFVPDPWAARPGQRMYRTGDLARLRPDGCFEYHGRFDHQIKVRGFRVELGEIEEVLAQHPAVGGCAVLAEGEGSSTRLVAYLAVGSAEQPDPEEIRSFLRTRLPPPMLPAQLELMAALPLGTGGKIDRQALRAALKPGRVAQARPNVAASRYETLLIEAWGEVLGRPQPGTDEGFLDLGGHSLTAIQVASWVRDSVGIELPVPLLFENATIAELARHLETSEDAPMPLLPAIRKAPRDVEPPLSFSQERIWFLSKMIPDMVAYNSMAGIDFSGRLRVEVLERVLTEIFRRHEILRTAFLQRGELPVQQVHPPSRVLLPVIDLTALPEARRRPETRMIVRKLGLRPFDLDRPPLVQWLVMRLDTEEWVWGQVEHHFLHDGWSLARLLEEMRELYAAYMDDLDSPLPELPIQFGDFAVWQRAWLESDMARQQLDFWTRQLADCPQLLELPTDRPRPALPSYRGESLQLPFPLELDAAVLRFARDRRATQYMVMMTAFQVLVSRYSSQRQFMVGTSVANRRLKETEGLLGMIVNNLILRAELGDRPTFADFLKRVSTTAMTAFAHQDLPFDRVVQGLQPERNLSYNPLVQAFFNFHDSPMPPLKLPEVTGTIWYPHNGTAKFDLNIIAIPASPERPDQSILVEWEYANDLFDETTVLRMAHHFENLVASAIAEPERRVEELELMSSTERQQLASEWNDRRTSYPSESSIPALFEHQARRLAGATAASYGERAITYRDLDRQSNRLAHHLRALGVRLETPVGLCMERSLDMLVAMLGILKAGGTYVPLDPSYPQERLAFMIEDARISVLIQHAATAERTSFNETVSAHQALTVVDLRQLVAVSPESDDAAPEVDIAPANRAYVIYTSGSTGRPKGTAVTHRAVVRLVRATDYIEILPEDRIAQLSSSSFDAATFEIWGALLNGCRLVGIDREVALEPEALIQQLRRDEVSVMFVTTALFNQLAWTEPEAFESLRCVLFGGEAVDAQRVRTIVEAAPPAHLLHVYGPTENTTFSTWEQVEEVPEGALTVPIGRSLANSRLGVFSSTLWPVPAGVIGELMLAGDGLARDYLHRPALTAEKFIPDPSGVGRGERLYRTGDLVRHLPDGRIEFVGRVDHQVKVRGFRIEPGEIETALRDQQAVRDAFVLVRKDSADDHRLVAYVTPSEGRQLQMAEVRQALQDRLPDYMVPSALVELDRLPLNPNGKIDRAALPRPGEERPDWTAAFVPAGNELEDRIAAVWREVLGVERVGVHDNFFDLGGHSLLFVRIHSLLAELLDEPPSVVDLFHYPTVRALANFLAVEPAGVAERTPQREPATDRLAEGCRDIAIIGMAGRFPGASNVEELWTQLCDGVEAIRFFSDEELAAAGVGARTYGDPDYVPARGVLEEAESFDASFFGYSPREAALMDPQQRVFLECSWQALEDGGYDAARYEGAVGVFGGARMSSYLSYLSSNPELLSEIGEYP
ncbi:MAG: amino acid adenylation domain-containing protein, partial [Acidobacteriota bacterium]